MNKNILLVTLAGPKQWSQLLNLNIAAQEGHSDGKKGKICIKMSIVSPNICDVCIN